MFCKFRKIIMAACAFFAVANAEAQGVPVYDNIANIQWLQQALAMASQLEELKNQYSQLQTQYQSISGLRDIGNILTNSLLAQYLSPDESAVLSAIQSGNPIGSLSNISGTLTSIAQKNAVISCEAQNSSQTYIDQCMGEWKKAAFGQYAAEQGYSTASQNITDLAQFQNAILRSTDAKSLQDLQARIAVEQLKAQNEATKAAAMKNMQDVQDKMDRLNASAKTGQMLTTGAGIRF